MIAPADVARWADAYERFGRVPHESPALLDAALRSGVELEVVDVGHSMSVFEVDGRVGRSFVQGAGAAITGEGTVGLRELVVAARDRLGVDLVYLPLLYDDLPTARALAEIADCRVLRRRPSPVIDWRDNGATMWPRCTRRLGSRANRRRAKFERRQLDVRTVAGSLAVEAVEEIEQLSWKAASGQDMASRGQLAFYRRLIKQGSVDLRVAFDGDNPVAYRLDATVGRTVFCLKWSFAERWRSLSPGFYLIAVDLVESYAAADIDAIDLFGAPDALKDSVSTGERGRIDVVWPDGEGAADLLAERAAHDRANRAVHADGRGIRSAYLLPAPGRALSDAPV